MRADVVVAGGGSAGMAAAIAAARCGARTVLLERMDRLGGMGATALVHTFCGLYPPAGDEPPRVVNPGLPEELAKRLSEAGGAAAPRKMGRLWVLPHDPATLARVLADWTRSITGLTCLLRTELTAASAVEGRLHSLTASGPDGEIEIEADAFVDASGDANLTALSGAAWESAPPEKLLRPACIVELAGVDENALTDDGRLRLAHLLVRAVSAGRLSRVALGCAIRAGVHRGQAFATLDLEGHDAEGGPWQPTDPACVARAWQTGRDTLTAVLAEWRAQDAGMAAAEIRRWPQCLGVRESRRACGVLTLSGEDILHSARFDDAVARASWPLEYREKATGPKLVHPLRPEPAQIPLRCLRHRDIANLWLAGRCLSADHDAAASIRVMGTCLASGQAAGCAAALTRGGPVADWPELASQVRERSASFFQS